VNGSREATDRLAEFVESYRFDALPASVVARTKEVLYDGLGALLGATSPRFDIGDVLREFVQGMGGTPEAQVFGTSHRTNCALAALVNGTLSYYCDIESHHPGAIMHAIAIVGPAALAVGEKMESPGRDVLAAIVVGIDVACRVSSALNPPALYARGFHPSCVAGTFGAMAAAGRLYGLRGRALRRAFGLAGTQASGLLAWVDDPSEHARPFNMGLASGHGVTAARLTFHGFGGPAAIFGGKYPLGRAFTGAWEETPLFDRLGEHFKVMELYFKRYACCAFIHPGLDGLLDILHADGVPPEEIDRIVLRFPRSGYKVIDNNPLRSHCAQYVLALAAYRGSVQFHDILHDQREKDPRLQALSARVTVLGDADLDATYPDLYRSIVEVTTAGGAVYARDVTYPKGAPENPLGWAELDDKFAVLTRDVLSRERHTGIADAVNALDHLERITALTRLLASEGEERRGRLEP